MKETFFSLTSMNYTHGRKNNLFIRLKRWPDENDASAENHAQPNSNNVV